FFAIRTNKGRVLSFETLAQALGADFAYVATSYACRVVGKNIAVALGRRRFLLDAKAKYAGTTTLLGERTFTTNVTDRGAATVTQPTRVNINRVTHGTGPSGDGSRSVAAF